MHRFVLLTLLALPGCAGLAQTEDKALTLAREAATFVSAADPMLRDLYEAQLNACFDRPLAEHAKCVSDVRQSWAPIRQELTKIRAAWCGFEPEKCK